MPALVYAQLIGQLLVLPDIGEFKVEWHLNADMKTIKVMYGLKYGAKLHAYLYILQSRDLKAKHYYCSTSNLDFKQEDTVMGGQFVLNKHSGQTLDGCSNTGTLEN